MDEKDKRLKGAKKAEGARGLRFRYCECGGSGYS